MKTKSFLNIIVMKNIQIAIKRRHADGDTNTITQTNQ